MFPPPNTKAVSELKVVFAFVQAVSDAFLYETELVIVLFPLQAAYAYDTNPRIYVPSSLTVPPLTHRWDK